MSEADKGKLLTGKGIVVTRPAEQAAPLAALIRAAGGEAILFPVIEIRDIEDTQPLHALIDRLDDFAWAIFVSPNAVKHALSTITSRRALPANLRFAAVGSGTVRELNSCGVSNLIAPAQFDSEALLALPALANVTGMRIVIFRGSGGREFMGDTLTARGARVEYAECYRRVQPAIDPAPLYDAWERHALHAITATSSEGVHNLVTLAGARGSPWLKQTPMFVPHSRIAEAARALDLNIVVPTAQGDDGLVDGLKQWFVARA